jgi:UDP:flavonoid glycosyltransferase YjiC (YdhE family)
MPGIAGLKTYVREIDTGVESVPSQSSRLRTSDSERRKDTAMRIALATEGTRGDVFPMLALAQAFQARGHDPVLCASPDFAPDAAERGIEFRPIGLSVHGFMDDQAKAIARGGLSLLWGMGSYLRDALERQFAELPDATRDADLIIGAGVQAAAGSCAELHGTPYRYVVYCPVIIESTEYAPLLCPAKPLPRWLNQILWRASRLGFNVALRPRINSFRRKLGLPPIADAYRYLLSERSVIACDRELISISANAAATTDTIRCLHPVAEAKLPSKLEAFLDAGPPPVYMGFGSMTDPNPTATTRTMLEAIERVGCRALISEGWAGLGQGALPEGVMTVGRCSHATLFRRVAAVVHHGGAGTTTTSARAGTPQILIPHLLDQYYWANRVLQLGVGPPAIRRNRLNAERLAGTLRATLDNELLAERAHELGARLRDAAAAADPTAVFLR